MSFRIDIASSQSAPTGAFQTGASGANGPCACKASGAWERFFSKAAPNLGLRLAVMLFGLTCIALGIAMAKRARFMAFP